MEGYLCDGLGGKHADELGHLKAVVGGSPQGAPYRHGIDRCSRGRPRIRQRRFLHEGHSSIIFALLWKRAAKVAPQFQNTHIVQALLEVQAQPRDALVLASFPAELLPRSRHSGETYLNV